VLAALIGSAMLRTSATFDEVVMIAGGARGYDTGAWDFNPEHPPLVQYLYGLPVALTNPVLPPELAPELVRERGIEYRYTYAREFFWGVGNDGQRLLVLGRLPALACALALVLLVFSYTQRRHGAAAALLAAALVGFLPDLLAHGGIAYNDVPLALAFFGALWALDHAIRNPLPVPSILAGVACGLALAVKHSAIALLPVAALLLVAELLTRRGDRAWARQTAAAALLCLLAMYLTLVLCHRGDFGLEQYRYGLAFAFRHVTSNPAVSYLLGDISYTGRWYYFPAAFLFKTSAAFHFLLLAALFWGVRTARRDRLLLQSFMRAPLAGALGFGLLLLTARQNIGFRYALPAVVPLAAAGAVGIVHCWQAGTPWLRRGIAVAVAWALLQPLASYPFFLSYMSEYAPGSGRNHEVLADSNLDWGQGLIALREWMSEAGVPRVYLSYFGSASPAAYGIDYVPLPSYFPLPPAPPGGAAGEPHWAAISATNLTGVRFPDDPFAAFRALRPARVLGGGVYLYQLEDGAQP
jgi:hypothetical protein